MEQTSKFYVEIVYHDSTIFDFNVELTGSEVKVRGSLCMIVRGTLMASSGETATAYNMEGFPVVSYRK